MSKKRSAEVKQEIKTTEPKEESKEVKLDASDDKPAKKPMFNRYGGPPPAPLRKIRGGGAGGGNSNLCKIQGVVTRVAEKTFNQASGPVQKRVVDVIVTNVIGNGSGDLIKTGIPGMDFILPSSKVDSPEKSEGGSEDGKDGKDDKDDKFKSLARQIYVDDTQIRKLNTFSTNFYKKQKNGEEAAGVATVDVGSLVEMNGICIDAVKKGGNVNFYRNAGKLTCLTDKPPSASELGTHMISLLETKDMQQWSAFQSSANVGGWFDTTGLNAEQVKQAEVCQSMWSKVIESTADRLGVMSQGKSDEEESFFKCHEERVRATKPEKVANGDLALFLPNQYDKDIVPVLQVGMTPSMRVPGLIQKLGGSFEEQVALPDTFAAQMLIHVEVRGKAVRLEMSSDSVFDKLAAIDAFEKGEMDPVLGSSTTRVPFTIGLRDVGWSFGTINEAKASMAASELLWCADFAAFPRLERIQDSASESSFPEGGKLFMDVPSTLRKAGLKVSQQFIKDVFCGGASVYIPMKQKSEDVVKLDLPTGVTELPYLVENGYEELSSGAGFNLENWESEGDLDFYVVFAGAFDAIKEDPVLSTSTEKGEAFIKKMDLLDTNTKIRNFFVTQGLVFAVKA